MTDNGFETRYVIENEHAPDQCEAAFAEWTKLHQDHPDLPFLPDGVVCGCPNGDHRGVLVLADEGAARTALKYERVGTAKLSTWVKVPVPGPR